jgi:hypothetical protein
MKKSVCLLLVLIGITGFSMGYVNNVGPKSKTVLPAVTNDLEKAERILVDLNSYYLEHPNYGVTVTHALYSHYNAQTADETYTGYYRRNKLKEHSVLMGIETIQNEQTKVVIDTNSKLVMVYNTIPMANNPGIEIISALKLCSSIRVNDKGAESTIELDFQDNQYPLSKMVIAIVDHRLAVLEMWHNETVTDDNGEIIKPRTKVYYTNYQENKKFAGKEFDNGHIVEIKNQAVIPKQKYINYRIMDLRTN